MNIINKTLCLITIFLTTTLLAYAEPLPQHEVFKINAAVHDLNTLSVNFAIHQGYYLYKNKLTINAQNPHFLTLGEIKLPKYATIVDKQGQKKPVFKNDLNFFIPILPEAAGEGEIAVNYQGCSFEGYCYPPAKAIINVQFDNKLTPINVQVEDNPLIKASDTELSATGPIEELLFNHSVSIILLSFFSFGLMLAFTPCVLPMIPVISSFILSQRGSVSTSKAFFISLSYVLGLAVTYAAIGICFALLGSNLQVAFQSPITQSLLALLFVVLALSMFEVYELRPPSHWQTWFTQIAQKNIGGAYWSSAILGSLSTLILSPCVTPPLVGTLAFIAQSKQVFLGGLYLFVLGIGSGIPLLLISTSFAHILPKAGLWMYKVKALIGILLLILAIQLLSAFIAESAYMALWACLLITTGVFIGVFTPAFSLVEKFNQSLGIICFLAGVLIFIGAAMGNTDLLKPLALSFNAPNTRSATLSVDSLSQLGKAMQNNKGKPILLDFYAEWCTDCKYIDNFTLQEPEVKAALQRVQMIRVDITKNNQDSQELLKAYNVIAPPTFIFIHQDGKEQKDFRLTGDIKATTLIHELKTI
ncbi:MAG: hypothetical protein A3F18_00010 [Legionellales bacterium RIFCSPHIGHO2_12_FULL_37_14]|nr:MAG: hypothetical protein A3F18_00010 [Legionellales bacterium RIFCSPHIGHO2_12_FULL_37_14]